MFDYRRNSDYLQNGVLAGTPRNAPIDTLFSDDQVSSGGNGESVLTYSATGGEYSFQDDRLIDGDITLLFRDGLNYYETALAFTGTDKEFQFDSATGTVTFPPAPFPELQAAEKVNVLYSAAGGAIVVTEPITLEQAKTWLKVTIDDEDDLITELISSARGDCEDYVGYSFVERTVTAIVRNDLGNIRLPYGPVQNVTHCYDIDGNEYSSGDYSITGVAHKRLRFPISCYVKVVYTAGYYALPKQFVTALKERLSELYVNRGDAVAIQDSMAAVILKKHRI